jgi:cytochrome c-type biogenesis protein
VNGIDLAVAFAAGFVSFASPCVWPVLPGYLSFLSGVSDGDLAGHRRRVALAAGAFVAGFALLFTLAGAGAGVLGGQFVDHRRTLELVAGALVVAMGLAMLVPHMLPLMREWRLRPHSSAGPAGALVAGAAFAIGWSPCIGPTLASILAIAGQRGRAADGAVLLGVYSLGLGVPFLLAGLTLGSAFAAVRGLRAHWLLLSRTGGAVLVVAGILIASGRMEALSARLAQV